MDRIKALWEGASVERLHATPHHQSYSVGMHCYRMMVLLYTLHPQPFRKELNEAILFHDSAERWVGDIPATAKWFVASGIKAPLALAEDRVLEQLGVGWCMAHDDQQWLKALDLLELYLFCLDERDMGNCNLAQCQLVCSELLSESWIPQPIVDYLTTATWERTDDSFGMRP